MTQRVVAFLDILGFKALIDSVPLEDLACKYERLITQMRSYFALDSARPSIFQSNFKLDRYCHLHIFSDSIILYANEDSRDACLAALLCVWRLQQAFLAAHMPLRGAIDYGEFYANPETGVFLGKALTAAYQLECRQQWIGVSVGGSVVQRYPELFDTSVDDVLPDLFLQYSVPMKDGMKERLRTVNWRFNLVVELGTQSLFPYSPDDGGEVKRKNSLKYAKDVVQSNSAYANRPDSPFELGVFWIGSKKPPFPHGDNL